MIEDQDNLIEVDNSIIIVLDSRNATSNNSPNAYNSDLTFNLQTPIIAPPNLINSTASILCFTCPNSQYVVNDLNNTLGISFNTTGTSYINNGYTAQYTDFYVTIANGNYNATTFKTALENRLNYILSRYGIDGNFSMTYLTNTYQLTLQHSLYYFYVSQNVVFSTFADNFNSTFFTIGDIIGFDNTKIYKTNPVAFDMNNNAIPPYNLTFPYPTNFGGLNNINIHLDNIKTDNVPYQVQNKVLQINNKQEYGNFSKRNIATSVPVNCNPNEVIYYQKLGSFEFSIKDEIIDNIRITLRDDLGNLIQLNGQNWNMTIEFNFTKLIQRKTRNFFSILQNPFPVYQ